MAVATALSIYKINSLKINKERKIFTKLSFEIPNRVSFKIKNDKTISA